MPLQNSGFSTSGVHAVYPLLLVQWGGGGMVGQ